MKERRNKERHKGRQAGRQEGTKEGKQKQGSGVKKERKMKKGR